MFDPEISALIIGFQRRDHELQHDQTTSVFSHSSIASFCEMFDNYDKTFKQSYVKLLTMIGVINLLKVSKRYGNSHDVRQQSQVQMVSVIKYLRTCLQNVRPIDENVFCLSNDDQPKSIVFMENEVTVKSLKVSLVC